MIAKVGDLLDSPGKEFAYCELCHNQASACKGDYFTVSDDYVLTCCNQPMILVTLEMKIIPITRTEKEV